MRMPVCGGVMRIRVQVAAGYEGGKVYTKVVCM